MNLENKREYERLKNMNFKYTISFIVMIILMIVSFFVILVNYYNDKGDNSIFWTLVFITEIPLLIITLYFYFKHKHCEDEQARYCPYCYEKDFKRTTLSEKLIREYNKQEKRTVGSGHDKREIYVPVRVEEWKGKYRNECCGKEYENTWEHRIDLRD